MYVPDDAIALLDEAISLSQNIDSLNKFTDIMICPDEEYLFQLQEDIRKLAHLLQIFGLRWCGINPVTHDWRLSKRRDQFDFIYWGKMRGSDESSPRVEIPWELAKVLEKVDCTEDVEGPYHVDPSTSKLLATLKEKVLALQASESFRDFEIDYLRVPLNCITLLDEIIQNAKLVVDLAWSAGLHGAPPTIKAIKLPQAHLDLRISLEMLGCRWFNLDSLTYDWRIEKTSEDCYFVSWLKGNDTNNSSDRRAIPPELAFALDTLGKESDKKNPYGKCNALAQKMRELKKNIEVSPEFKNSVGSVGNDATGTGTSKNTGTRTEDEDVPVNSIPRNSDGKANSSSNALLAPENANRILDEIIAQCDKIIALETDPEEQRAPNGNTIASEHEVEKLFEQLNSVGHKWCDFEQLNYEYCTRMLGQDYSLVFYPQTPKLNPGTGLAYRELPSWYKEGPIPEDAITKTVPAELGIVLHRYEHSDGYWPTEKTVFVRDSLTSLKSKLSNNEVSDRYRNQSDTAGDSGSGLDTDTPSDVGETEVPPDSTEPFVGLSWEDITLEFLSNDLLQVKSSENKRKYHYAKLGFQDGRKGDQPDTRWLILIGLAKHGEISWKTDVDQSTRDKAKSAISVIRKRLKKHIKIKEDPFHKYTKAEGYRPKFRLIDSRPNRDRDQLPDDFDNIID